MEDDLKKIKNGRRPQKNEKIEDDLKKIKNGRQPQKNHKKNHQPNWL
jgi:hypothetical protein